jgi:hypothetical protein
MTLPDLENLVATGKLKYEPASRDEFDGLVTLGEARFKDARVSSLSLESRFDLAYGASHAFALAALRWHGYRTDLRYIVFQCLEHTLDISPALWRVLDKAHGARNAADYGGHSQVNPRLLQDVLAATAIVRQKLLALDPIST